MHGDSLPQNDEDEEHEGYELTHRIPVRIKGTRRAVSNAEDGAMSPALTDALARQLLILASGSQGPKRCWYSPDMMKDLTISACTKFPPAPFNLLNQKL